MDFQKQSNFFRLLDRRNIFNCNRRQRCGKVAIMIKKHTKMFFTVRDQRPLQSPGLLIAPLISLHYAGRCSCLCDNLF